jgi:hypothetical protein
LPPVQQHQIEIRADAANRDLGTFTERAVDRYAADALQGFGEVGVRELADVFGNDAVHHALRVALQFHSGREAASDTGYDHLFEFAGLLRNDWHSHRGSENQ